ncbi:MAG: hypothetical protein KDD00_16545 [Ignavibacteriae bacterium]|nr:hypothetical protein [Ignavibacteriota bacterium]
MDILIEKYDNLGNQFWSKFYNNPFGTDKGMGLTIDHNGDVIICGYVFNNTSNSNDIITIKLSGSSGDTIWSNKYVSYLDDKALGVEVDLENNIYVTGYITNSETDKDFILKKYSRNGIPIWQHITPTPGDDIATDILLDDFYAYVVGYTTERNGINTDIKIQTYDIGGNTLVEDLIYNRPGSNEKPTDFVITEYSNNPISKSRSSVVSLTDEIILGIVKQRYLTVFFNEDSNHELQVRWSRVIGSPVVMSNSIPTAMTTDRSGSVFVTGYMQTPKSPVTGTSHGLDFATVKYDQYGNYGWNNPGNIIFSNYNDTSTTGMDDRASSIKINESGVMYVAGMSQGSPNGFSIAEIKDEGRGPILVRQNSFVPNYLDIDNPQSPKLNLWAKLELTSDGTPLMITMGWNENEAHWAAVKYGQSGNIEYTINNEPLDKLNKLDKLDLKEEINIYNTKSFKPVRDLE